MKRDFLEKLEIPAEAIDKIMAENGKDIESAKAKFTDYDDIKKQLETANATLEKFKDYDQTKADVEKYKTELEKSQKESAAKRFSFGQKLCKQNHTGRNHRENVRSIGRRRKQGKES